MAIVVSKGVDYYLQLKGNLAAEAKKNENALKALKAEASAAVTGVGAVSAGFAAAGAAAVAYANDITGTIDELNTLAKNTGLALETVAGLEVAAKASGKELHQLVPKDLAKRIEEARRGTGEALKGFDALGMVVDGKLNPALRDSDAVLRASIDGIMAIEDPTKRSAAAILALGENGGELITAFGDSSDLDAFVTLAGKIGTDVGPEALAITAEWQQATTLFSLALQKLKSDMLPLVSIMADTVRGFAAMAVGAKAFVSEGGLFFTNWPSALAAARDEVTAFAGDIRDLNEELARTNEEVEQAAKNRELFTSDADMQELKKANEKAAKKALEELEKRKKKEEEERKKAAERAREERERWAKERDEVVLKNRLLSEPVGVLDNVGEEMGPLIDELIAAFEDIVKKLEEEQKKAAENTGPVASEEATFADNVGAMQLAFGTIVDVIGVVGMSASMVQDVTASIQSFDDDLLALAQSVPELIDAIAQMPVELLKASPEIAMAIADAMLSVAMANVQVVGEALGYLFDQLPGDIAEAIADALKGATGALNPFDGDGRFVGADVVRGIESRTGIDIPFLDTGGEIKSEGLAYVHAKERVLTADENRRGVGGVNIGGISIQARDPRDFLEQLQRIVGPYGAGIGLVGADGGLGG